MAIPDIDNSLYDAYGDRWYTAQDDPVAILRAETKAKLPWILARLPREAAVLDVGCGGGFLSNGLAPHGYSVTGIDLSPSSLQVAARWDRTGKVRYLEADATALPFADASFDAVAAMDILEHVENPGRVIQEAARALRPGGVFFYSTLNRNFLSWLVGIQAVRWLVRNSPPRLHAYRLFLKPAETEAFCARAGLEPRETTGLRPSLRSIPISCYFTGVVPESMAFRLSRSRAVVYIGMAVKR